MFETQGGTRIRTRDLPKEGVSFYHVLRPLDRVPSSVAKMPVTQNTHFVLFVDLQLLHLS